MPPCQYGSKIPPTPISTVIERYKTFCRSLHRTVRICLQQYSHFWLPGSFVESRRYTFGQICELFWNFHSIGAVSLQLPKITTAWSVISITNRTAQNGTEQRTFREQSAQLQSVPISAGLSFYISTRFTCVWLITFEFQFSRLYIAWRGCMAWIWNFLKREFGSKIF